MRILLKSLCTFRGLALREYVPENSANFHVLVHMTIGPDDQGGGHNYSLEICTPVWLDHDIQNRGPIFGRHLLLVNYFDEQEIVTSIEKILAQCCRSDWAETSVALARFFAWEYEDFQL